MSETVFVTGSDGFVGSALCPHLERNGYRLLRGVQGRNGINAALNGTTLAVDIGPETDWHNSLTDVDVVIHLAARVHIVRETERDPLSAFRQVNTAGTEQLARSAVEQGVKRFIFISTIGVNGNFTHADQSFNEQSPVAPHNSYAQSKWEAEQILYHIAFETGLEVVVIRPPLIYGPKVPGNFLKLLKLVDLALPFPLAGVRNRRSFVSVKNLASFLVQCVSHPNAAGQTFLISDNDDLSTAELIRRLAHYLEKPVRLFPFPESILRLGIRLIGKSQLTNQLIDSLTVDSSKARQRLDWTSAVSSEQGLAETVRWFRAHSAKSA